MELDAALREFFVAGEDVGAVSIAAERQNGWVLQHQKRVTNQILLSRGDDLLLDSESIAVRDAAEIEEIDVHELCAASPPVETAEPVARLSFSKPEELNVYRHS